ncbi:hypothetical protein F5883DRAFT_649063 [Diaporthe sp. PMI_573]|nr:hypothetical protein F5883DRAFT_649063 [Diaporthaceae sp. PMI_573]
MSSATELVQNMDMCPPNFWDTPKKIGFVDLRDAEDRQSHQLFLQLLRDRPCGDGAVPPNLLDEYDKGDDRQRSTIACKSLDGAVEKSRKDLGVPSLPGHRRYGDDFLHAWLLVRYLACLKHSTGSNTWALTISRYLTDMVAHIHRSLRATAAHTGQRYGALAKTIAGDTDKPFASSTTVRLIDRFHQCIYGAGGRETSHGKGIGHALNFNGGAPVLLSQGSVLDMDGLQDPLHVTFDRIEHVISGLSPLSLEVMSNTHVYFSALNFMGS